MQEDYIKARKIGQREYREAISKGDYPYLPVLDDILKDNTSSEFPVGLMEIPMEFVVGTKTAGRTNAFSRDFMLTDTFSCFQSALITTASIS